MAIYAGDIITKTEEQYVEALEKLWDMVSEAVEAGYLRGAEPDANAEICGQMLECNRILATITKENEDA